MDKGTPVTTFSALTTSTKHLEKSRKPDDLVKFISNYIDVYQILKKFLQVCTYNIGVIILLGYPKNTDIIKI